MTLLDDVFTNTYRLFSKSAVIYDDLSDHLPVLLCTKFISARICTLKTSHYSDTVYKRCYSEKCINNFLLNLQLINWSSITMDISDEADINKLFDKFNNIYLKVFDASFPHIKSYCSNANNGKPRKDWMTPGLCKCCSVKLNL